MRRKFISSMSRVLTVALSAATLAFSSCADSDVVSENGTLDVNDTDATSAIQFGTYLGQAATRVTTTYGTNYKGGSITNNGTHKLHDAQFAVFAYYTGVDDINTWGGWNGTAAAPVEISNKSPNFMYNQQMEWNTSVNAWTYDPVKYWPNGIDAANTTGNPSNTATEATANQKLSFFAYAPYIKEGSEDYTIKAYADEFNDANVTSAISTNATSDGEGIVAITKNDDPHDVKVKYILKQADEEHAVDLLWGLRGQKSYKQTNNTANTINDADLGKVYNTDLTKQTVSEKVKFLFKHALARVGGSTKSTETASGNQICGLQVVVDIDANSNDAAKGLDNQAYYLNSSFNKEKTLVTIKSVKIEDAYTYTHGTASTSDDTHSDFLTSGWFDIMNGTWKATSSAGETSSSGTVTNTGATYNVTANTESGTFNLSDEIKEIGVGDGMKTLATTGLTWSTSKPTGVPTGTPVNVYADENVPGLLLIPGTNGNTLYVTVNYIVRTADPKLKDGYTNVEQVITNKVTLDGSVLKSNKYYTLVMHLGLTSVKFEAVVADWQNTDNATYNENGTVNESGTPSATSVWLPSNVIDAAGSAKAASTFAYTATTDGSNAYTYFGNITMNGNELNYTIPATTAGESENGTLKIISDLSRYLGALWRINNGASVTQITYNNKDYFWNTGTSLGNLKGSNWFDTSNNSLVSKISADLAAALAPGGSFTAGTEQVEFDINGDPNSKVIINITLT